MAAMTEQAPNHVFHIQIDREHFEVSASQQTGAQLRQLPKPAIGQDRDLFEVIPGKADLKIGDADVVTMHDGLRFFTAPSHINPGIR